MADGDDAIASQPSEEEVPLTERSDDMVPPPPKDDTEYRYGQPINPNPVIRLTTPMPPEPLDEASRAARRELDLQSTSAILTDLSKYIGILRNISLFDELGHEELENAARALEVRHFSAGEMIYDEGDRCNDCWVVEMGTVVRSMLIPGIAGAGIEWKETRPYKPGRFGSYFGERGLRRGEPRPARMICRTDVKALRVTQENYVKTARMREYKEDLLRSIGLFAQMTDEQIGKLAAVLEKREYGKDEQIVSQGDLGDALWLVESGEASTHPPPPWLPTTKTYKHGDILGEMNLIKDVPADATVTSMTESVVVYKLSRADFEARLGSLIELQEQQRLADPRTLLSDFYRKGDRRGPAGTLMQRGLTLMSDSPTSWFAVYRPCSRDSIAKMLGGVGVGKGLNVKGKSAQKNRLSGFVPFLQIHNNSHKRLIGQSPKDARTHIFYKNVMAREEAFNELTQVLREGAGLEIAVSEIFIIKDAEPQSFGLDVPEPLVREAYIMRPDLTQIVGWETGRPSVPQYMDMNLHCVRSWTRPAVCLVQFDTSDPMNPHGLLIAYQESTNATGLLNQVKPVCSDFDTFTVGSKGMHYETTASEQVEVINWQLDRAEEVLAAAASESRNWTSHWLDVIAKEEERGWHPDIPTFGFGESTSTRLIEDVVKCTASCGAVRHGAECFNFW